jgi:hypothetical protein
MASSLQTLKKKCCGRISDRLIDEMGDRMHTRFVITLALLALASFSEASQAIHRTATDSTLLAQTTARRDLFIRSVAAEGYSTCRAPTIVLKDTQSYGNYQAERNELVIATWPSLTAEERQGFEDLARQIGHHSTGESVFSGGTHRWVFAHELGHWWQACRKQTRPSSFEEENGVSRIALAFWREQDPKFAQAVVRGSVALTQQMTSPIPAGQSVQSYVDAHFADISKGDTYTWVQATSIVSLADESPNPSFLKALSQPLYPW